MLNNECLGFSGFYDLFMPYGALNSPAELHGVLCGKLCAGMDLTRDEWLYIAWDCLDLTDTPDGETQDEVALLLDTTLEQLNSGRFDMQLLLPDDDTPLDQRTRALSEWCHGFLSAFGSLNIDPEDDFYTNVTDILKDMAPIVQAVVTDDDQVEQEQSYFEIIEYVRMETMHFYLEYRIPRNEFSTVH